MFGCLLVHIRLHMNVYSSPSLHNEYLWYDKLWGAFSASSYLVLISFQSCPHHGLDVCRCCSHLVSITYCLQIYNDNKHSKHSWQIFYENIALHCSKSGTICRVHRLWRKENALVGSSDLFSISRPLLKNLEWSEMGSQLQNRLNIAEQKNNLILRESFHWDCLLRFYCWVNPMYHWIHHFIYVRTWFGIHVTPSFDVLFSHRISNFIKVLYWRTCENKHNSLGICIGGKGVCLSAQDPEFSKMSSVLDFDLGGREDLCAGCCTCFKKKWSIKTSMGAANCDQLALVQSEK